MLLLKPYSEPPPGTDPRLMSSYERLLEMFVMASEGPV